MVQLILVVSTDKPNIPIANLVLGLHVHDTLPYLTVLFLLDSISVVDAAFTVLRKSPNTHASRCVQNYARCLQGVQQAGIFLSPITPSNR